MSLRIRAAVLGLLPFLAMACETPAPTPPMPASAPSPGPHLTLVAGRPAEEPVKPGCALAAWTTPWGSAIRICMESPTAFEITPHDVTGFRIDDRSFGDQRWYFVSAYLKVEVRNRIWALLDDASAADRADGDRPYAVLFDGKPSIVQPAIGIGQFESVVAVTQDLSRAEAVADGWGVPVTRVISAEIARLPMLPISIVQLIANPDAWIGKRISVQGYLAPGFVGLYLSRDHAQSFDHASSVDLQQPATDAASAEALSACEGRWALIEAFVDSYGGLPRLTHVQRVTTFPDGRDCWPPPQDKRRPHY